MTGLISLYAVCMMLSSGIRIVGRLRVGVLVWHNLLISRKKQKVIAKRARSPQLVQECY